jgi:hypothetical protein
VAIPDKRAMQRTLRVTTTTENSDSRTIRLIDTANLEKKTLQQLIDSTSISTLKLLKFDTEFLLHSNPKLWNNSKINLEMKEVVDHIRVVNDSAERAIALATTYNDKLTKDESEKQQVIQVAADNRKRLPNADKKTIASYNGR